MVFGVHNSTSGPAELLALEKQQVVIPNSSPQLPGEGRNIWRRRLYRGWDWTLSPWEGGYRQWGGGRHQGSGRGGG